MPEELSINGKPRNRTNQVHERGFQLRRGAIFLKKKKNHGDTSFRIIKTSVHNVRTLVVVHY